jgi:hypothetical protein
MNVAAGYSKALRPCTTCKYYRKGFCRLFLDTNEHHRLSFVKAQEVRLDEKLCGPEGIYWALPSDLDPDQIWYSENVEWK